MPSTEKLLSHEREDALVELVVITHPRIEPVRVANEQPDDEGLNDVTHQGEIFQAFPFDLQSPGEGTGSQTGSLRVQNVDRRIGDAMLAIAGTDPPEVRLINVLASSPDLVEWSYARLLLRNVTFNPVEVTGELRHPEFTAEPWPNYRMTPGRYPAVHRARLII